MFTDSGLTGNQVRAFRDSLGEGQMVFSRRIGASQGVIHRIEKRGAELIDTPETRLIRRIAADHSFAFDGEA